MRQRFDGITAPAPKLAMSTRNALLSGFVGEHGVGGQAVEQGWCGGDIADLTSGDNEAQRPAKRVGEHVDQVKHDN